MNRPSDVFSAVAAGASALSAVCAFFAVLAQNKWSRLMVSVSLLPLRRENGSLLESQFSSLDFEAINTGPGKLIEGYASWSFSFGKLSKSYREDGFKVEMSENCFSGTKDIQFKASRNFRHYGSYFSAVESGGMVRVQFPIIVATLLESKLPSHNHDKAWRKRERVLNSTVVSFSTTDVAGNSRTQHFNVRASLIAAKSLQSHDSEVIPMLVIDFFKIGRLRARIYRYANDLNDRIFRA